MNKMKNVCDLFKQIIGWFYKNVTKFAKMGFSRDHQCFPMTFHSDAQEGVMRH